MDHLTKEKRSWNMSKIRSKDTKPEMIVRSMLHKLGYRFRLNGKIGKKYYKKAILPGKPDIVLAKYKAVIFVHGCFWHQHENCKRSNIPKSNQEYWIKKLKKNVERDTMNKKLLNDMGFSILYIWECETKNAKTVQRIIENFFKSEVLNGNE